MQPNIQPGQSLKVLIGSIILLVIASSNTPAANAEEDPPYIAVTEIEATVDGSTWLGYKNSKAANFQTMLETQLTKINRFKIMERNRVDQVFAEQGLQGSLSRNNTILHTEGVDYIVYGSVTRFGSSDQKIRTGKFSTVQTLTTFGVDIKVVEVTTGEIRKAQEVEETIITGQGLTSGNFQRSEAASDPLADVQRAVARKTAALITSSIFPIRVVAIDRDEVYLNFGAAMLEVDDFLDVVREGKEFVDPDTGRSLGATRRKVATILVVSTSSEFSTAKVSDGVLPEKGDVAIFVGKKNGRTKNSQRAIRGKKI